MLFVSYASLFALISMSMLIVLFGYGSMKYVASIIKTENSKLILVCGLLSELSTVIKPSSASSAIVQSQESYEPVTKFS